jgi:hypothetical protein
MQNKSKKAQHTHAAPVINTKQANSKNRMKTIGLIKQLTFKVNEKTLSLPQIYEKIETLILLRIADLL